MKENRPLVSRFAMALAVLLAACLLLLIRSYRQPPLRPDADNLVTAIMRQSSGPFRFVLTDSAQVLKNTMAGEPASVDQYVNPGQVCPGRREATSDGLS